MAKTATQYVCSECGWSTTKWIGRCPQCGQWGTVEEFHEARPSAGSRTAAPGRTSRTRSSSAADLGDAAATPITEVGTETVTRVPTGFEEFDRVLGGGVVPGSVTLIAGEPGIGKSTLLLQTAGHIARTVAHRKPGTVLYVSGEESQAQVRLRAGRINAMEPNLLLASTTDLSNVLALIERNHPALAIVDSAQTIISQEVDGISGGSTQVREVASALIDTAKTLDIPVFLVGHVTKDGSIAGPRTLEHLVDVVCQFEGDGDTALRMLRAVKNRFGPTDEVGCFDMSGEGIEEVTDPAGLFLSSPAGDGPDATVEGTCVTFTLDGHRSLPIEIQALVTNSVLPTPRRAVNGVDPSRIAMLTAVLYRHGKLNLLANDLYISTIAGGQAREPGCDLAIVAALASAARSQPLARTTCAIGEISLTGQVRPVPRMEYRLREAARLGFTKAVVPPLRKRVSIDGITLVECANLRDALAALGMMRR